MRFKLNQAHQAAKQQRHQPKLVIGGESERGGEGEGGEQEAIDGGDLPEAVKFWEHGGGGMGKGGDYSGGLVFRLPLSSTQRQPENHPNKNHPHPKKPFHLSRWG